MNRRLRASALAACCLGVFSCARPGAIQIGSKAFTESVILGELATQLARADHPNVRHLQALGGTRVLWDALVKGDIDLYPEYTGTITQEILAGKALPEEGIAGALAGFGIKMSQSLGFDDSYALGMKESLAARLNISTISDLKRYPELRFGFSNEFIDRKDGWSGLRRHYQLPQKNVAGLEHQLAYRGLDGGAIAVTDLYSTDADILYYHLRVLKDDRHFFPEYTAVFLYRDDLARRGPKALAAILRLQGAISQIAMAGMNEQVKIAGTPADEVASHFLAQRFSVPGEVVSSSLLERLVLRTRQHVFLVSISLMAAIFVSIPLGILAFLHEKLGQVILAAAGVIQTIPSLALIVFMIPMLGIGNVPAIVALFLYSLLPIVRNTYSGLKDIPEPIRESASALGLPRLACLRLVELPIAARSVLSGLRLPP